MQFGSTTPLKSLFLQLIRKVYHSTFRTVLSRDKSIVTAPAALLTFRYVIPG